MRIRNTGKSTPYSRKIICEEIVFDTIREYANYYNIKEKAMDKWMKKLLQKNKVLKT